MRRWRLLAATASTPLAGACSGLGVQEAMQGANESARYSATAIGLLALLGLILKLRVATPVALGFLTVHPAWTMSSGRGDCGAVKETAAFLIAIVVLAAFAWDPLRKPGQSSQARREESRHLK